MRNSGDRWHDQRLIDLIAVLTLGIVIVSALSIVRRHPVTQIAASLIEPSQNVHW
jgi:hypothetical protein